MPKRSKAAVKEKIFPANWEYEKQVAVYYTEAQAKIRAKEFKIEQAKRVGENKA